MAAAVEAKEFAERFPQRVNKVMDALAEGQITLNIQGIDEKDIMRGVQKLANRVTTGLVVASLVIGAALIMRIPTDTKLFGYPALAIVLFMVAAVSAIVLLSPFRSATYRNATDAGADSGVPHPIQRPVFGLWPVLNVADFHRRGE